MPPWVPERGRRWIRRLAPVACVALAPKCVLCVAGYCGLGTTLGWTGAEICGAPGNTRGVVWLVAGIAALATGAWVARASGKWPGAAVRRGVERRTLPARGPLP